MDDRQRVSRRRFLSAAGAVTAAAGSAVTFGDGVSSAVTPTSPTTPGKPPDFRPDGLSVTDLARALERGETTSVDLVQAYRARIAAYDQRGPRINAIITVF